MKPADKAAMDREMLKYLKRGPASIWSVNAHFELHTDDEVLACLRRLEKAGKVTPYEEGLRGWLWSVVTSPDECVACEVASITYSNHGRRHTCRVSAKATDT